MKKEDAAYFVDKWRPLAKTWDKTVPLAAYGDYLIEISAAAASSASAAAFPISVAGGGQKVFLTPGPNPNPNPDPSPNTNPDPNPNPDQFLYGDGIVGAWVDDYPSGARNFRYLKATVLTPTRFNATHKDTVLGVMSDDRSTITWQATHLAGFGTWIKCSVDTSRCTGPLPTPPHPPLALPPLPPLTLTLTPNLDQVHRPHSLRVVAQDHRQGRLQAVAAREQGLPLPRAHQHAVRRAVRE